jgi:uncharacterized protein (DUF1330 family)
MAYYSMVTLTPTDESWIPGYLAGVTPLVAKHGGKYLARTTEFTHLEGDGKDPALCVLLEWPSKQAFEAFYGDPDYQPHLKARLAGCGGDFFGVEGKDEMA